jgi:large subunit GTPase 1
MTDHRTYADFFDLSERYLTIPRRPAWDYSLSRDVVDERERAYFLGWRREVTARETKAKAMLCPYEKNLEVWRQLWRVVERSDVILQIVDARNPMCFRSADFERYVTEQRTRGGTPKQCILLLNKSDLLTEVQREAWAKYLNSIGVCFIFFSALEGVVASQKKSEDEDDQEEEEPAPLSSHARHLVERKNRRLKGSIPAENLKSVPEWMAAAAANGAALPKPASKKAEPIPIADRPPTKQELERDERIKAALSSAGTKVFSTSRVFRSEELMDALIAMRGTLHCEGAKPLTVGMVGYPNVGKSSTINALLGMHRVVVSMTPGKTKHMQTLEVAGERRLILCDCPGLVFPSFCTTTEDMVCDGILPIAHMKDFLLPSGVVCRRIPRIVFEAMYNVSLSLEDDRDESPTPADRLLNAIARRRGYMADHDRPVRSRAALLVLRDYVAGKLVFVHPPPLYQPEGATTTNKGAAGAEEDWDDVDDEEDRDGESLPEDALRNELEDDDDEALHLKRFFAQVPVSYRWAVDLRAKEEEFNVGVNDHIVAGRNALLDKKIARKQAQDLAAAAHADPRHDLNVVEDGEGDLALAVDPEDGIVCVEVPLEESEVVEQEAKLSKRQSRREAKRGIQSGRRTMMEVPK